MQASATVINTVLSGLMLLHFFFIRADAQPGAELACQLAIGTSPAESFGGCARVNWVPASPVPYTWFYRLTPGQSASSTTWRGGLKVDVDAAKGQWAGFGWGSSMVGSNAVLVRKCSTCPTGARIDGFKLTDYDEASKIPGGFNISDASAALAPDGTLTAVFTVTVPRSIAQLTGAPFQYIAAVGPTAPDESLRSHATGAFPYGVQSFVLKAAAAAPGPAADPPSGSTSDPSSPGSKDPSPPSDPPQGQESSPTTKPTDPPTNEQESAPPPETVTSQNSSSDCFLSTASGETKTFSACAPVGSVLKVHWKALNTMGSKANVAGSAGAGAGGNITVEIGMDGTVQPGQWLALGFSATPGRMIGSTAMVITSCAPACPEGAELKDYYLAGKTTSAVNPPGQLAIRDVKAGTGNSGAGSVVGFFTVNLPETTVSNGQLPILYATGPLDSSGKLQHHTTKGAASLDLVSGAATSTTDVSSERKKNAHGWLMVVGWTIILAGAVVARSFRSPLGPLWFQIHRAAQVTGLICVLAGFIIIFSALGGKKTIYNLHFNLGVAAFTLGMAQITALVARPHLDSTWRRPWALAHHWIGRSAVLLSVANIYYGIIHVKKVGSWAVIAYSIVFGIIIGIGALKESFDYLRLPPPALMNDRFTSVEEEREAALAVGVEGLRRRSGGDGGESGKGGGSSPPGSAEYGV